MSKKNLACTVGICLSLVAFSAFATVGEKVEAVGQAASGVVTKTQRAVARGAKAAASGVERGAKAAGSAVGKGAKKLGLPSSGASAPKP
jgi:hypothetical protein